MPTPFFLRDIISDVCFGSCRLILDIQNSSKLIKISFLCKFDSLLDSWKVQLVRETASTIKWSANETFELDLIQKY